MGLHGDSGPAATICGSARLCRHACSYEQFQRSETSHSAPFSARSGPGRLLGGHGSVIKRGARVGGAVVRAGQGRLSEACTTRGGAEGVASPRARAGPGVVDHPCMHEFGQRTRLGVRAAACALATQKQSSTCHLSFSSITGQLVPDAGRDRLCRGHGRSR